MRYHNWSIANKIPQPPSNYSELDLPNDVSIDSITPPNAVSVSPTANITILTPKANSIIYLPLDTPEETQSISLTAKLDQQSEQLLWYVDGQPYKLVSAPYATRWKLKKGKHTFQAKLPFQQVESDKIQIQVD